MTREMISPNHMLGVISSPKSSLPHLVFLHTHLYHRGTFFIYLFPSKAEGNSHHSTRFLKYSVSHQSPWMEPCPPAVSPVRQRWTRLGDLWAVAGSKSSDTCLIHICFRTHGLLIFSMCVLGLIWVRQSERERVREAAVPHYTSDGSVGRRRKMN